MDLKALRNKDVSHANASKLLPVLGANKWFKAPENKEICEQAVSSSQLLMCKHPSLTHELTERERESLPYHQAPNWCSPKTLIASVSLRPVLPDVQHCRKSKLTDSFLAIFQHHL